MHFLCQLNVIFCSNIEVGESIFCILLKLWRRDHFQNDLKTFYVRKIFEEIPSLFISQSLSCVKNKNK